MITKEQALRLHHGDLIYELGGYYSNGLPRRWRVNGQVKTWKTRPDEFSVPIKFGLYTHDYLTESTAKYYTIDEEEAKDFSAEVEEGTAYMCLHCGASYYVDFRNKVCGKREEYCPVCGEKL